MSKVSRVNSKNRDYFLGFCQCSLSLAASSAPDKERFPLFEDIKDRAVVAELEPGDALYLPKLWWHKVESTVPFNVLVNYWWDAFRLGPDAPYTSLLLSMITIAERPPAERQAWQAFFDHYVSRNHGHPLAHLPPEQHGLLGAAQGKLRQDSRARDALSPRGLTFSASANSRLPIQHILALPRRNELRVPTGFSTRASICSVDFS